MPFSDDEFDIAISALVLNFVPDLVKMATEMTLVVRRAGTIASYVWDFAGRKPVTQHIAAAIAARDPQAAKRAASGQQVEKTSEDYLKNLFNEAGLVEFKTHAIKISVEFKNFEEYRAANTEFASPIGQFVGSLSRAERDSLKNEVMERLPFEDDGSIRYVARANAVRSTVP